MSDRELLEKAARAAGISASWKDSDPFCLSHMILANGIAWDPLNDDGDALRLAVKLRISIDRGELGRTVAYNHMKNNRMQ